jgi:hemerythrin-like metal-binding protein
VLHFSREERLFSQHRYPEAATHKREHAEFVAKLQALREAVMHGRPGIGGAMMAFLEGWVRTHVTVSDRKYVALMKACLVK